jgi:hypothetical protein
MMEGRMVPGSVPGFLQMGNLGWGAYCCSMRTRAEPIEEIPIQAKGEKEWRRMALMP